MKLVDLWRLGRTGDVDRTTPLGLVVAALERLERVLKVLQLYLESQRLAGLVARADTAFSKTVDAALEDVPGLSLDVDSRASYGFVARLYYDAGAGGGSQYAIGGTCTVTEIVYRTRNFSDATDACVEGSRHTALASAAGQTGAVAGWVEVDGTAVVDVGGTLTAMWAQNAADAAPSTLLVGSWFELRPIG
jgi:hypothetical protein